MRDEKGFSLMETVVALAIFGLIVTALYSLFNLGIKVVNEDKARVGARVIAEERMEIIRNLSYDDVGTVGGVPAGDIEQSETTTLNNVVYTISTDVHYVDDAYDDVAPTDTVNVDYKKVRVEVDWNSQLNADPIVLVSDIVPQGMESLASGGTIYLEVSDSTPNPVSGATVQIVNNEVTPVVNITSSTNADGIYMLPGASVATQSYEVYISKAGYSSAQTYSLDPINNPNPSPAHLSVGDGAVTTKSFIVDLLANFTITAQLSDSTPVSGFTFTLKGDDKIGTDGEGADILEYEQDHTTDASGVVSLTNLDPDTYDLEIDSVTEGYDLSGYHSSIPYVLGPGESGAMTLILTPHADHTLLVAVSDAGGVAQETASVRLYDSLLTYDVTQQTDVYGQTFFTPLTTGLYNLEVTKAGYDNFLLEVNIDGQTQQDVSLSETTP